MKRLLTCLFLILGLGLAFSVNTNASDKSLKSAMKIKEKVKYSEYGSSFAYWQPGSTLINNVQIKINDLRGDGNVFYVFDSYFDKYYRINEDDKVVSSGKMNFKEQANMGDKGGIFELTEDNLKFFLKISISSQVADIKSKFYDYKGYRRYQFVLALSLIHI